MRRAIFIFGLIVWFCVPGAMRTIAQTQTYSEDPITPEGSAAQTIDGVAARIEDDIITESEVRELGAFQQLVEGQAKSRTELIRELADQWIVRGEAKATKYPPPSSADVDLAYEQLAKQFGSPEEFQKSCTAAGVTESAVRRLLAQQLYLSHFLDFRFRPAAQVDEKQVAAYYDSEFAPQLKAKGQPVPAIEEVDETIREVLVQRVINERATKWLDDTRQNLKIDIVPQGSGS